MQNSSDYFEQIYPLFVSLKTQTASLQVQILVVRKMNDIQNGTINNGSAWVASEEAKLRIER